MINSSLQSMFTDSKPVNDPTITVTVSLKCSKLVEDLASTLMQELIRVAGPVGDAMLRGVDSEGIRKYLATLGWLRRVQSTGSWSKPSQQYKRFLRSAACPVLWYQVLIGMGKAIDRDYSVEFVPGTSIDEADLIDPDTLQEISDIMFRLQNNGFKVCAGIPLGEEGELDFMAMAHVEDSVVSYRRTHPVYGFLASFFASHEVSNSLGALVRVRYGYDSDYRVMLSRVVAGVGGE